MQKLETITHPKASDYSNVNNEVVIKVKAYKIFILLFLAVLFSAGNSNAQQNKTLPDNAAKEFSFTDFSGKPRKFSEFRGKYVLLDFWATWCKPCLADIPKLKEIYAKHKANGFEIIGMDAETIGDEEGDSDPEFAKETAERAKQIVTTRGVSWTNATSATAVPVAAKMFGVKALPAKILIDPDGKIVKQFKDVAELDAALTEALSQKK